MVRLSERSQEHPSRSMRDLEVLLKSGETALYGQICWSIANDGTESPTAGDTITLEGADAAGAHTTKAFPSHPREHQERRAVPRDEDLRRSRSAIRGTQRRASLGESVPTDTQTPPSST